MTTSVRMPVSVASAKGISALIREAASYRVVLTSLGHAVAVVDTAERIDEDLRKIREAARLVVESMAENAKGRSTTLDLEEVCNRLGISVVDVHARAQQLQDA
jgi:KaiC/GvpD/RAD55 family RecA-like ATPase